MNLISLKPNTEKNEVQEISVVGYANLLKYCGDIAKGFGKLFQEDLPDIQVRVSGTAIFFCKDFSKRDNYGEAFSIELMPYGSNFLTDHQGKKHRQYNEIWYKMSITEKRETRNGDNSIIIEDYKYELCYRDMEALVADKRFVDKLTKVVNSFDKFSL